MKIAIIGPGNVGSALARGWSRVGHSLFLGVRNPNSQSAQAIARELPDAELLSPLEAAQQADVIALTVPFPHAVETALGLGDLTGGVLIDCTNPVGPNLTHALQSRGSGTESLQDALPGVPIAKAFSIYGFEVLGDAAGAAGRAPDRAPVMMIAGDDSKAIGAARSLAVDLGFDPLQVGGLEAALQLEHMTLLWVRMVRANGHAPNLAWYRS